MKKKCSLCNKVKGKRGCHRHELKMVCSRCCAEIRDADCDPCSYYHTAEKYHAEKYQKSGGKSFMIELDETIEKQVDNALEDIEKKRFFKAEKVLTHLLQANPDNHYVNYGIGALYAFQDENKKAIRHFQKAVEIFPYFVEAHYNLGIAYHKEVDIANMVRSFRNVLRLGARDEIHYTQAKRLLADTKQMVRDVNGTDLDTFIKAQDIFQKGVKLMEKGEWEKAIDAYEESLTLNASTPQPHGNLGICYAALGRKEDAIEAFDRALVIDPNYEVAIVNKMHTERLDPGEALDVPMRIVEYYKDYSAENRSYIKELADEMNIQLEDADGKKRP
ncbi:MAG: tetratricopeptide repeat protein [Deltaproteobacteria bacterium]|nr:tetratricopeptide repeat protein [Deltaproteobacteria bacterium]